MSAPAALDLDEKATWLADAGDVIERLAKRDRDLGIAFTADDLREHFDVIGQPADPNWIGNAFTTARTLGVITADGFAVSTCPTRHGGVIRVWRAAT